MRNSRIKEKLAQNKPALCTTVTLACAPIFEIVSMMGFDGIWLDMEHHGHSVETAADLMRATRLGTADIVARPAKGELMRMGRMLEMGAQAIMYPRCESPAEAAEVVRWSKFAPLGRRGFDGGNADNDYGGNAMLEYIEHANRESFIIIQLEDQVAVDQAEAIAAVPGVDAIMLGPADFSILEGVAGQFDHARIQSAIKKVASAAKNTGKHWARTIGKIEHAQESLELGCGVLFFGADVVFLRRALQDVQEQFSKLGFTFDR